MKKINVIVFLARQSICESLFYLLNLSIWASKICEPKIIGQKKNKKKIEV